MVSFEIFPNLCRDFFYDTRTRNETDLKVSNERDAKNGCPHHTAGRKSIII